MSRRSSKSSKIAYMEEEDDSGNVIGVTYAASIAPGPNKERMNTGKSRRGESPGPGHGHNDSDSTAHARHGSRPKSSRDRDRSIPPGKKAVALASRQPSMRHSRNPTDMDTTHHHRRSRDEAAYYGIDPDSVLSASSRPRSKTAAPRPNVSGFSRPPVSNMRYQPMGPPPAQFQPPPMQPPIQPPAQFQQPPPMQSSYAAPPLQQPSHAPLPWQAPGPRFSAMGPPPPPLSLPPVTAQPMYPESFPRPQTLQQRFDLPRPQTSVGHRPPLPVDYNPSDRYAPSEKYYPEERQLPDMRRLSISARPSSARPPPQDSPFAPPMHAQPRSQQLAEYQYPEELYDETESVYPDTASSFYDLPPSSYVPRTRRPSVGPTSVGYDRSYAAEPARPTGRRDSFYGGRSVSGAGLEDKLRQASSYQEEISGGVRLTAETLNEANRVDGPRSRSTRSSGSRDESEWRQSATTRTTRSSAAEDDRTMKVRGPAYIRMGETEVQCEVGAEVDIAPSGITASRRSDRTSYIDSDDRRYDRPALRSRAASQAASYTQRAIAPYDYSYGDGLDYTRPPYGH